MTLLGQDQVTADFSDGMTEQRVDGYPGTAGNGWGGGWLLSTKHKGSPEGSPCIGVTGSRPLSQEGGDYLSVRSLCQGDSGGRVISLARKVVDYDGVELARPHTVRFFFRIDDASALAVQKTAYRLLSSDRPHSPNAADHRWWAGAFNLGKDIHWTVRNGVGGDGNKVEVIDTGVSVEESVTYLFEFFIDPEHNRYVLRLTDDRGNRFQSEALGFRSASGKGGDFITFHEQKSEDALDRPSAFSFDAIAVSPGIPTGLMGQVATDSVQMVTSAERTNPSVEGWPAKVTKITYTSSADGSSQPALVHVADSAEPRPLLVALHSWNGNYLQRSNAWFAQQCIERGWHFVHPDFRGPNTRSEAMGSDLVVADIVDAVHYVMESAAVDRSRVYLVGASGGGHAALLVAGRVPELWAGVSAWVPITDLVAWHNESLARNNTRYADNIRVAIGGVPDRGSAAEQEALARSPITWIDGAVDVALDINTGIYDGHRGSVPVSHSLYIFNQLAMAEDRISEDDIGSMVETAAIPASLQHLALDDPTYASRRVLLRKESGKTRLTVFDGGHEIVRPAAIAWLEQQRR